MAKRRCNGCKKYFDKDDLELIGVSSFCSRDCFYKKENSFSKPKSNPHKSFTGKSKTDFSPEVREHIFKRDGYRCGLCGKSSSNLVIHHIHYRTEIALGVEFLTSAANGITLCNRPCHLDVVHQDKQKWQPFLRDLAQKRESDGVI